MRREHEREITSKLNKHSKGRHLDERQHCSQQGEGIKRLVYFEPTMIEQLRKKLHSQFRAGKALSRKRNS